MPLYFPLHMEPIEPEPLAAPFAAAVPQALPTNKLVITSFRFFTVLLAFLIAALGQAAITRNVGGKADWLGPLADPLRGIYVFPKSVLLGAILLALGASLFALAVADSRREKDSQASERSINLRAWLATARSLWLVPALVGLGVCAYLFLKLHGGSYEGFYPGLLAAAVAFLGVTFWRWDRRLLVRLRLRLRWWEVTLLAAVVGLYMGLNMRDLDGWRYSAIGDEYAFFGWAKRIASGFPTNLFTARGVYDYRPMGGSALQAASMKVFGQDQFGWKMSNVVLVAATLPALYLLARHLFNQRVALVATAALAFSHQVFAYTHIGYDNLQVILPSVLCFALFVAGLGRSSLLLFAAGVVAGLSAYTFPAARVTPLIIVAYLLTLGWKHWKVQTLLPLGLGAVIAVAPILIVSGQDFWTAMSERSVFGFTDSATEGVGRRILENIPRTLFIFNFSPGHSDHYVSRSVLDPVSAVFYVMGLAVALTRFRQNSYRFVLIWLALGLFTTGILSPYDRPAEDRVHFDLPPAAILVGIGVHEAFRRLSDVMPPRTAQYTAALSLAALLPTILVLNSIRFWVETPRSAPTTFESVVARAVFSSECSGPHRRAVVIAPEPAPLLEPLFSSYDMGDRTPILVSFSDVLQHSDFDPSQCFVLSGLYDSRAESIRGLLSAKYPQKEASILKDYSGQREILVFR